MTQKAGYRILRVKSLEQTGTKQTDLKLELNRGGNR